MAVTPKFAGDPQDAPWKRWAQGKIETLDQVVARNEKNNIATNKAQDASLALVTSQVQEQAALVTDLQERRLFFSNSSNPGAPTGYQFQYNTTQETPVKLANTITFTTKTIRNVLVTGNCQSRLVAMGTPDRGKRNGRSHLLISMSGPGFGGEGQGVHETSISPYAASTVQMDRDDTTTLTATLSAFDIYPGTYTVNLSGYSLVFNSLGVTGGVVGLMTAGQLTVQIF